MYEPSAAAALRYREAEAGRSGRASRRQVKRSSSALQSPSEGGGPNGGADIEEAEDEEGEEAGEEDSEEEEGRGAMEED